LYSGKDWKSLDRFRGKKDDHNIWQIEKWDIVAILDWVFENFDKNRSFKSQILGEWIKLIKIWEFTPWESLRFAIDLIQQIRNSGPKDIEWKPTRDDDFILSPVRDKDWKHFDSREFYKEDWNYENIKDVVSGDANWAYNIARKWIIMFERIKENIEKPDLLISDEDWDNWLSKHS
jgi:CRISPR-associated protein Cpf1